MEAILYYCEDNSMEIETAAKLINRKIKETIECEASDLNMIKEKGSKLPL